MSLTPKPLAPGWFKRTMVNAIRLSLRSPGWWFSLYVGAPVLSFYVPYIPFQCFLFGLVVGLGTFLCFNCDHLSQYHLGYFFRLVLKRPQSLIILLLSCLILHRWVVDLGDFSYSSPYAAYLSFGAMLFALIICWFFASLFLMIFWDFPYGFYLTYKTRNFSESERKEALDINKWSSSGFSLFAFHLIIDTDLSWGEAVEMSYKGKGVLGRKWYFIGSLPCTVIVLPILLGLFVPWIYCIYRELFWQTGLRSPVKKPVAAGNLVPEPNQ